jgi:hypothetical protein
MPFVGDEHLVLKQVSDRDWCLVELLIYQGKKDRFVVDKEFVTDLASVPRPLVWLIPRYGRYTRCAVLHDWLWRREPDVHKADANGLFRRAMREEGVSLVHRWVMWAAVGLASTAKEPDRIRRRDIPHILGLIAVGIPGAAFAAVPFLLTSLWIGLFYLVDAIGYLIDGAVNKARPDAKRKRVNRPNLGWKLS